MTTTKHLIHTSAYYISSPITNTANFALIVLITFSGDMLFFIKPPLTQLLQYDIQKLFLKSYVYTITSISFNLI